MRVKEDNKFGYIEITRALACILVIITHVMSPYYYNYLNYSFLGKIYVSSLFIISKIAVPVFVMISGGLLLRKDYNIKYFTKKAYKVFLVILAWSIVYIIFDTTYNKEVFTLVDIVNGFLNTQIKYHLWYMYMLFWLYLMIPFIKPMTCVVEKNIRYFLGLSVVVSIIPLINSIIQTLIKVDISTYVNVPILAWQIICLLLGYLVINKFNPTKKDFIVSIFVFIISYLFTLYITDLNFRINNINTQVFLTFNINMILMALMFLVMLKYVGNHVNFEEIKVGKFFIYVGKVSLGIYLIHPIFLDIFVDNFSNVYNVHLQGIYIIVMTFVVSLIAATIIHKNNLLSKIFLL